MMKIFKGVGALTLALIFSANSAAQNVTTEILGNAQDYSDRWVTYGKNYGAWRYMPR